MSTLSRTLLSYADTLCDALSSLRFGGSITHVYNPLEYARAPYRVYLERFLHAPAEVVFFGMNPGPYGMTQTGVPFGEIHAVRDWLGIEAPVAAPSSQHPKRPVLGFACPRSEISGARFWGLWQALCGTPERFFSWGFVANYCPLVFMDAAGRNITPDKLPLAERTPLFAACDAHLAAVACALAPSWAVGVGKFAEGRATAVLGARGLRIASMLHPSPASPHANRDWAGQALAQLAAQGLDLKSLSARYPGHGRCDPAE